MIVGSIQQTKHVEFVSYMENIQIFVGEGC